MSIKYYHLANGEELPEEFCAVRDVGGEPEEYTWYEHMDELDHYLWKAFRNSDWIAMSEYRKLMDENAKLREFASEAFSMAFNFYHGAGTAEDLRELTVEYRELGIEVDK